MSEHWTLTGLNTLEPVVWEGPHAAAWFRGGPSDFVATVSAAPTCRGQPIDAAYGTALDPMRWRDAEAIVEGLERYLYAVAERAIAGDSGCRDIAERVITGWNLVEARVAPVIKILCSRIGALVEDWRWEIDRRQWLASLASLQAKLGPWRMWTAHAPTGERYALVAWNPRRSPMPLRVPFLVTHDVHEVLKEGALRLAAAEVIAKRRHYALCGTGNPCADVIDAADGLSADERRLLLWGVRMYPLAAAPGFDREVRERAATILRELCPSLPGEGDTP